MLNRLFSLVKSTGRDLIVRFLFILVLISTLLAGLIYIYYHQQMRIIHARVLYEEKGDLKIKKETLSTELNAVTSDLKILRELPALMIYLGRGDEPARTEVASAYFLFCRFRGIYDQVRYLDETGMEIVRVNFNNGHPAIVAKNDLQPKGQRYYFTDAITLKRDEIYVSPFDLNIEGQSIELPYKPMVRFSAPVFDRSGQKRGVVVLNYLGSRLLDTLRRMNVSSTGLPMMLNADGYWLYNPSNPDSEWAFMFPDMKHVRFGSLYPHEWETIQKTQTGQIETAAGFFTFDTLSAIQGAAVSSSGTDKPHGASDFIATGAPQWKLISFVPPEHLRLEAQEAVTTVMVFSMLLFVMTVPISWVVAKTSLHRQRERQQLTHQALHDPLTDLPNRLLFMDRLDQAVLKSIRDGSSFGLFFIDLDGFKSVNDRMGHNAGDQVLMQVADRIVKTVRASDAAARMGGDEFCALMHDVRDAASAAKITEKLLLAISQPMFLDGQKISISASIGISIVPVHGQRADELLAKADEAMYQAKQDGGNRYYLAV